MPTLHWIGKEAVRDHHRQVPYHLLRCDEKLSVGDPGSGNLLVQGDNLLALKALLPYYAGQVKCIYIDPPYNTGNENWVYNDAVNSPEMRKWLGKVVGDEAEDLSRHDKWLGMMYPRMKLLREFLREDGAVFVSIADHEVHNLRHLMDEVFGVRSFVATIIWQKVYSPKSTAKHLSEDHDYIVIYARDADAWRPNLVPRTQAQDKRYKNPDNDPRGPWKPGGLDARNPYSKGTYAITCPSGRIIEGPPKGAYWRVSEEKLKELDAQGRVWWGKKGDSVPQLKRFLSDVMAGLVPQTLWTYREAGHTQEAKQELVDICRFEDSGAVFITPKPLRLVRRILQIASGRDSLVMDSFAGSGTTGHAVLDLNKEDGGNRRFILIEMEEAVAKRVAQSRLRTVITGEGWARTEKRRLFDTKLTVTLLKGGPELVDQMQEVQDAQADEFNRFERRIEDNSLRLYGIRSLREVTVGLGGGFRYCTLAEPLFDETGSIRPEVTFADLAAHVFFTETGEPVPKRASGKTPLIGKCKGTAYYLLFNGILGDKRPDSGNVLTSRTLAQLPSHDGPKVVYGEGCRLGPTRLRREHLTFKQIPYEIKAS